MRGDAARRARGHAPGMPTLRPCSWGNNLIFQKALIFRKSLQICGQGMQPRPWARHASKAKAAPYGHAGQGRGMQQPRPRQPMGAGSEGQGMLACMLPRPRHAAKAKACLRACCQGHGMLAWACWHAPGCRQVGTLACPWAQVAARP